MPPNLRQETTDMVLAHVSHLHHLRARALLEGLGLYRGQPPMLRTLWENDGQSHAELAHELNVQPATITKMVQRMERAGFVRRRADANDERISRVYLTNEGRAVQSAVTQSFAQLQEETLSGLNDQERQEFHRLLVCVRANLSKAVGEGPSCWHIPAEPDDSCEHVKENA